MKHVANIISVIRIVLSITLLFLAHDTAMFITIYILCGLSDVLDGYIARKTKTQSDMGARLDSIADFIMYCVILFFVITWVGESLYVFLIVAGSVFSLRLFNLVVAVCKYRTFVSIHTWGNKLAGFLVFIAPVLFLIWRSVILIVLIGSICTLAAVEETIILLISKKLDLNKRSIFTCSK